MAAWQLTLTERRCSAAHSSCPWPRQLAGHPMPAFCADRPFPKHQGRHIALLTLLPAIVHHSCSGCIILPIYPALRRSVSRTAGSCSALRSVLAVVYPPFFTDSLSQQGALISCATQCACRPRCPFARCGSVLGRDASQSNVGACSDVVSPPEAQHDRTETIFRCSGCLPKVRSLMHPFSWLGTGAHCRHCCDVTAGLHGAP